MRSTERARVRVELVYFTGCPSVPLMRELLTRCLARLGRDTEVIEVNTDTAGNGDDYGRLSSPTVLVDGVDVLGNGDVGAKSCRSRLPTEDELMSALGGPR
jgi:hypothetical protein